MSPLHRLMLLLPLLRSKRYLRKTRHFNAPLRALAARASTGGCCLPVVVLVIGENYCKATVE